MATRSSYDEKQTPDRWDAYRWYILANQVVTKLDANSYMTETIFSRFDSVLLTVQ